MQMRERERCSCHSACVTRTYVREGGRGEGASDSEGEGEGERNALKVCFRPVILFHGSFDTSLDKHDFFFVVSSFFPLGDLSKVIRAASTIKPANVLMDA